ncbi:MAG: hypothetical protein ACYTFO_10850, partial [Planctomycetota bacterium]
MANPPICQFGPGGEFVRPWPPSATPLSRPADQATEYEVSSLQVPAGAEAPLVSYGPEGIQWTPVESMAEAEQVLSDAARFIVGVFEATAEAHGSQPLT